MIKSKKQMLLVISVFAVLLVLTTVTYAFFNYTRTGIANSIHVGRIYFNSEQGNTINLTNVFPIEATTANLSDNTKVGTVTIDIVGDTTYSEGIEYLISAVDVNNSIINGSTEKNLPISIDVSYGETSGETIGTLDNNYFVNRGGNSSIYKVLAKDTISNDDQLIIGYIAKGATGIDGTITIKAYLDNSKILISDTYPSENVTHTESSGETSIEVVDYTNGTPTSMAEGKIVFTTGEWNSFQANGVSFKIKVEANEGIWVDEILSVNKMGVFPSEFYNYSIKEVYFNRMNSTLMQSAYDAATIKADITYNNEGKVLAWFEENQDDNNKYNLIIASDGETYLTTGYMLFAYCQDLSKIEFNNANTSLVQTMEMMFKTNTSLQTIDLSNLDLSNVQNINQMFMGSGLTSIDFRGLNTENIVDMGYAFGNCSNLETAYLSGLNLNKVTTMSQLFYNDQVLETVDFSNSTTRDLETMSQMFISCYLLKEISLSGLGGNNLYGMSSFISVGVDIDYLDLSNFNFGRQDMSVLFANSYIKNINLSNANISNATNFSQMFLHCNELVTLDLSNIDYSSFDSMVYMFTASNKLTTIYVSEDWNIDDSVLGTYTFGGCTSLIGGAGTTYDTSMVDKSYAHIDGGQDNPGYFTLKTS